MISRALASGVMRVVFRCAATAASHTPFKPANLSAEGVHAGGKL